MPEPELLTGVCTSLEEELNDYFRSGKRKEQQMLEEENSAQPWRETHSLSFSIFSEPEISMTGCGTLIPTAPK